MTFDHALYVIRARSISFSAKVIRLNTVDRQRGSPLYLMMKEGALLIFYGTQSYHTKLITTLETSSAWQHDIRSLAKSRLRLTGGMEVRDIYDNIIANC